MRRLGGAWHGDVAVPGTVPGRCAKDGAKTGAEDKGGAEDGAEDGAGGVPGAGAFAFPSSTHQTCFLGRGRAVWAPSPHLRTVFFCTVHRVKVRVCVNSNLV